MATPPKSHMSWRGAAFGAKRVTKAMPTPERAKVMGSSAGSALGASLRTAMWAAMNATKMPMGTPNVLKESS